MGLKIASAFAITALFALMYAIVFMIGIYAGWGLYLMIALTLGIVFLQYLISPIIIGWIYRIQWIPFDQYKAQYPHLAEAVEKVVAIRKIKMPRMGIIYDGNPNAFTYGWTKNSARVVITEGILRHLNKKEQKAVVAHELGHVVHSDFILMTVVFAIPLVLLTIARWAYYSAVYSRGSREKDAAYVQAALIAIAVLSYITYYIGYMISLFISRIREYYADQHAAELMEDPNALSTALVKIAYGLLIDSGNLKDRNSSRVRATKGLGIFDPKAAQALAANSVDSSGKLSRDAVQAAAAWDLFNPWAKYYQLFSTHPLPAKRIMRLNSQCETYGIKPELDFSKARQIKEEQAGKSMLDEFLVDLTVKLLPMIVFVLMVGATIAWIFGMVGFYSISAGPLTIANIFLLWAVGFYLIGGAVIVKIKFMYRSDFAPKEVVDLITQIKASPVRCVPAVIEGTIIGRGIPGYILSEDIYFQDKTGLLYIDYRSGIPFGNFFFAIARVKKLQNHPARIRGWYRRGPSPYLQVDRIDDLATGKHYRNYYKHTRFIWAALAFIIGLILLYAWFLMF